MKISGKSFVISLLIAIVLITIGVLYFIRDNKTDNEVAKSEIEQSSTETVYTAVQSNGEVDNISKEFLAEKTFGDLTINNIRFYYKDGISKFSCTFVNKTNTLKAGTSDVNLQFLNTDGEIIHEVKKIYIPSVVVNGGNEYSCEIQGNIVSAYDFKFSK